MSFYQLLPYFCIFMCMFAGIIVHMIKNPKTALNLTTGIAIAVCILSAIFLVNIIAADTSYTFAMGKFAAPFGNEIKCGPLQGVFAVTFSGVMALALLGGRKDVLADVLPEKMRLHCIMLLFTLASLLVLTYTNDAFTAYVFIEIGTIAACALVMAKDSGATIMATLRYLFMSLLGSGLFLMSLVIFYTITGYLLMPQISEAVQALASSGDYKAPLFIACALMFAGLGIKSAMFPFHRWLPDAHGSATTSSSAILSGLVLKGYIVLIITMIVRVFTIDTIRQIGVNNMIFILGLGGMIVGSIYAIRESHIKRMLAYSSVAQIGYIFMGIGICTPAGIAAACFHILVHACCKPLLFVSAGRLSGMEHHKKDLKDLRGSAWKSPLAGIGFAVGGLSMVGIPLFAGFASKFNFASAGDPSTTQMLITLIVLCISSVLNALYYIPAIISIWSTDSHDGNIKVQKGSRDTAFAISAVILIAAVFVLGIFYSGIWNTIVRGLELM